MPDEKRQPLPRSRFVVTCEECGEQWFDESVSMSGLLTRLYEALRAHAIQRHDWRPPTAQES